MTGTVITVQRVLDQHPEAHITEADYAALLDQYLRASRMGAHPSQADIDFMAERGGSPEAREYARTYRDETGEAARARAAATTTSIYDLTSTLSRADIANLLGIDPTSVSHRVKTGSLLAWRISRKDVRYPDWQVSAGRVLPHLRDVLAALPDPSHPREVTGYMTTPKESLDFLTPARWLAGGGDPDAVVRGVRNLGRA